MAKPKTTAADINTLNSARLYCELLDPKFASDYIVAVAQTADEAALRRAVEDLITAMCIHHERSQAIRQHTKGKS